MPTNVMPLVTPSGTDTPAPVASAPASSRVDTFRHTIAARFRAGVAPATLVREQTALLVALQEQPFVNAMAAAYATERDAQTNNPALVTPLSEATRHIEAILKNRVQDTQQNLQLLADPAFLAAAQQEAAQPAPATTPFALSAEKKEEVIRRLVQPQDVGGAEPSVHVAGYALGQRITHQTLANIFRPTGDKTVLRTPLIAALTLAWPEAPQTEITQLAEGWLKARHDAAHSTADGLAEPNGEFYVEAIRRAEAAQAEKLAARAAQAETPKLIVATPAAKPNLVVNRDGLLMDTL